MTRDVAGACLWRDHAGNMALVSALGGAMLLATGGAAVDYATLQMAESRLQAISDEAALSASKELAINQSKPTAKSTALTFINANLESGKLSDIKIDAIEVTSTTRNSEVSINITATKANAFGAFLGTGQSRISVRSKANLISASKLCVLALDPSGADAVMMTDEATIGARDCAVQSNSKSPQSISVWNKARIEANLTCAAGGYSGTGSGVEPAAITDCAPISDPLQDRPPPKVANDACDHQWKQVNAGAETLSPGVYCGGLNISTGAKVTFKPGIYVMRDGPFQASNASVVYGKGVGFYMSGDNATFKFNTSSVVELYAPDEGELAGLLFFSDRASNARLQQINSENAHVLVGTLYLPNDTFQVAANTPVAEKSAFTAIVAKRIVLNQGPRLVLNTNYSATTIPIPASLAKNTGMPVIVE